MDENVTISLSVDDAYKVYAVIISRLERSLEVIEDCEKYGIPVSESQKEAVEKYDRISRAIIKAISDSKQ